MMAADRWSTAPAPLAAAAHKDKGHDGHSLIIVNLNILRRDMRCVSDMLWRLATYMSLCFRLVELDKTF